MRSWTPALIALALTACGISKQDHQRALDKQKAELTAQSTKSEAELRSELEQARSEAAKAQADVDAAKKAATDEAMAKVGEAQKKLAFALSAEKAREAQVAVLEKRFDEAAKLAEEVGAFAKDNAVAGASKPLEDAAPLLKKKDAKAAAKLGEAASVLTAAAK